MYELEILYQSIAIAGAIGSFVGGIASVISLYLSLNSEKKMSHNPGEKMHTIFSKRYIPRLVVGAGLIFLSVSLFSILAFAEPEYKNVRLVANAWAELNDGNYIKAIKVSKECIVEFQDEALEEQQKLEKNNVPNPPIGKTTKNMKETILHRGLLNDVGACWYIIGVSELKLGNKSKAKSAFNRLKQFSYARIFDPAWGGFWSPSKKANSYLKSLENELY